MADQDSSSEEIEILSPEEMRNTESFLPHLNGVTIWRKYLQCSFCQQEFLDYHFQIFLLQWPKRSDIHLMCEDCWKAMLLKETSSSSGTATE